MAMVSSSLCNWERGSCCSPYPHIFSRLGLTLPSQRQDLGIIANLVDCLPPASLDISGESECGAYYIPPGMQEVGLSLSDGAS